MSDRPALTYVWPAGAHPIPVTREQLAAVFTNSERYWDAEDFFDRLERDVWAWLTGSEP